MELTTEIVIDMRDRYINTIVDAVQYDKNSRIVKATLLSGASPLSIPTGATYRVNFKRADGSSGSYTELSDGSSAVERSESNVLKIGIHELITNTSGKSLISVTILDGDSEISTFSFILNVQKAVTESSDLNKKYPDTYDATATAQDMAEGVTSYVNGEKLTGAVKVVGEGGGIVGAAAYSTLEYSNNLIYANCAHNAAGVEGRDRIVRTGAILSVPVYPNAFGDARPEDVAAGKTFTSVAGLLVEGTGSGGCLIAASGEGDSIVISTTANVSAIGDDIILGG